MAKRCDAWFLPCWADWASPDRPVDRSSKPHILAAIQLFTCQRELHAAQGAKCRVGHGSEIADPVNTLVDHDFAVDNLSALQNGGCGCLLSANNCRNSAYESSRTQATAGMTRLAPCDSKSSRALESVAPVVRMSSTRTTQAPSGTRLGPRQASRARRRRSSRRRAACRAAGGARNQQTRSKPNSAQSPRAIASV